MKEIDYYKNNEILENSYYQIPQELFVNNLYKTKLNSDSKILYTFLLDRLSLSQKNHWFDEYGRVYLIFTREEVQNKLCLSEKTVTKAFKQLLEVNLIAEKRQGLGKPNSIYVGKFKFTIQKFITWVCYKFSAPSEDSLIRDFERETHINFNIEKQLDIDNFEMTQEDELEYY